jgi:hypothetical protein
MINAQGGLQQLQQAHVQSNLLKHRVMARN